MKRRQDHRGEQLQQRRHQVAAGAARLIARHGLQDYREAKRRAARDLGIADEASLPPDALVREQLIAYQRLFRGDEQLRRLQELRQAALEAMGFFAGFHPRLVGSVLDGTADTGSPVRLQVFAEDAEEVSRLLLDADMPTRTLVDRWLRVGGGRSERFPAWVFQARGIEFEVLVLPMSLLRQALPGDDGQPMARAGTAAVRALLADQRLPGST